MKEKEAIKYVWVFTGSGARFASGIFEAEQILEAEEWIRQNKLSGMLTKYPVGMGVYQWAIEFGVFTPKKDSERSVKFIEGFTSASQDHIHFDCGVRE